MARKENVSDVEERRFSLTASIVVILVGQYPSTGGDLALILNANFCVVVRMLTFDQSYRSIDSHYEHFAAVNRSNLVEQYRAI